MMALRQSLFTICAAALLLQPAYAGIVEHKILASIVDPDTARAQAKGEDYARKRAFFLTLNNFDSENALQIAESLSDNQIAMTIRGLTKMQEKYVRSDDQYLAEYLVSVSEEAVKKLVTPEEKADADAAKMLVLPVLVSEDGILLWEGSNLWRSIFNGTALASGQNLLMMPHGDPTDRAITDGLRINTQRYDELEEMSKRYGADEIVIATARYEKDITPQRLQITIRRLSEKVDKSKSLSLNTDKRNQTPESLLPAASQNVTAQLIEVAKNFDGNVDRRVARSAKVPVRANLSRVRDWAVIRKTLDEIPGAVRMDIASVSVDGARGTVYFNGTAEGLAGALKARGIGATSDGSGGLVIQAP